jgi:molybdopterin-guanine dinucleotide biosynthesis protein A
MVMKIEEKMETTIVLTSEDVQDIVKQYLENEGYVIDGIYPQTKRTYIDHTDHEGCMDFDGFRIKANIINKIRTIK